MLDATCAPADIKYPTDLGLLHHGREILEGIIDTLHQPHISVKWRNRRRIANKLEKRKPSKCVKPKNRSVYPAVGEVLYDCRIGDAPDRSQAREARWNDL